MAAVIAGEAERGLAFDVPPDQQLRILATVAGPFGVVVTPGQAGQLHQPAVERAVRLPRHSAQSQHDDAPAAGRGLRPQRGHVDKVVETNEIEMMRRLAVLDRGIAFLNAVNVDVDRRRGELAFIPIQDPALPSQQLVLFQRAKATLPCSRPCSWRSCG